MTEYWRTKPRLDLSGQKFGRLTAIEWISNTSGGRWRCICDCGAERFVPTNPLRNGNTTSCGCSRIGTRGSLRGYSFNTNVAKTPTYRSWVAMRRRCRCDTDPAHWPRYGGRGITIDPAWDDFHQFLADMGERPEGKTLGRIDLDGNYCKENCRWETPFEQTNNRSVTLYAEAFGRRQTLGEWARELGIKWSVLNKRIKAGYSIEQMEGVQLSP